MAGTGGVMAGMQWLLDVTVILLLAATLFHATRLERALGVLKRDRAVLEQLVDGFNTSTREAQAGIERLRGAADGAGRTIERQTAAALSVKDDLLFLVERGERLAEQLDQGVRASRPPIAEPRLARTARDAVGRPPRPEPAWNELEQAASVQPANRVRSQAERDLLAALRTAR